MPELLLALDVGTTSAKAAVVSPQGRSLGLAATRLRTLTPAPGRVEQDPRAVWRAVRRVAWEALADAGRAGADLAAIGLTTQRASLVLWDRTTGAPVGPMVVWSDLSGVARAAELRSAGFLIAAQQPACKLEAAVAASGRAPCELAWGGLDSWLLWKLTGGATHATDASQAWPSGYLDLARLGWNQGLIARQGLDALAFPRLADTWGLLGMTAAGTLGCSAPVTASVADQQAALIAHGEAPGTAKITWGTSGTFDVVTAGPEFHGLPALPPLILGAAQGETRFCLEGMILSAGSALDWLRGRLGLGPPARLDALAARVRDTAGAAFLPALQGLGAPHGDSARRARIGGLSAAVGRPHLARAGFEGLAFRADEILRRAEAIGVLSDGQAIGVDGGLTRSAVFLQILADLAQRPARPLATSEATLMGAALLAARGAGLGCEDAMRAALASTRTFEPAIGADEAEARREAWTAAVHGP